MIRIILILPATNKKKLINFFLKKKSNFITRLSSNHVINQSNASILRLYGCDLC
jgi:hypothetical protein